MRCSPLSPPDRSEMGGCLIHELVRDFPELGQVLSESGVRLPRDGARRLAETGVGGDAMEALAALLDWRRPER